MSYRKSWRKEYDEGVKAIEVGELTRAHSLFSRAIEIGADRWEAYYARAWTFLNMNSSTSTDKAVVERD
jgi:hypothetical protein